MSSTSTPVLFDVVTPSPSAFHILSDSVSLLQLLVERDSWPETFPTVEEVENEKNQLKHHLIVSIRPLAGLDTPNSYHAAFVLSPPLLTLLNALFSPSSLLHPLYRDEMRIHYLLGGEKMVPHINSSSFSEVSSGFFLMKKGQLFSTKLFSEEEKKKREEEREIHYKIFPNPHPSLCSNLPSPLPDTCTFHQHSAICVAGNNTLHLTGSVERKRYRCNHCNHHCEDQQKTKGKQRKTEIEEHLGHYRCNDCDYDLCLSCLYPSSHHREDVKKWQDWERKRTEYRDEERNKFRALAIRTNEQNEHIPYGNERRNTCEWNAAMNITKIMDFISNTTSLTSLSFSSILSLYPENSTEPTAMLFHKYRLLYDTFTQFKEFSLFARCHVLFLKSLENSKNIQEKVQSFFTEKERNGIAIHYSVSFNERYYHSPSLFGVSARLFSLTHHLALVEQKEFPFRALPEIDQFSLKQLHSFLLFMNAEMRKLVQEADQASPVTYCISGDETEFAVRDLSQDYIILFCQLDHNGINDTAFNRILLRSLASHLNDRERENNTLRLFCCDGDARHFSSHNRLITEYKKRGRSLGSYISTFILFPRSSTLDERMERMQWLPFSMCSYDKAVKLSDYVPPTPEIRPAFSSVIKFFNTALGRVSFTAATVEEESASLLLYSALCVTNTVENAWFRGQKTWKKAKEAFTFSVPASVELDQYIRQISPLFKMVDSEFITQRISLIEPILYHFFKTGKKDTKIEQINKKRGASSSLSSKTKTIEKLNATEEKESDSSNKRSKTSNTISSAAFSGCVFVVSGSFSISQKAMKSLLASGGGIVSSSFSKKITHCIANEIGSEKTVSAEEGGLPVCTEEWVNKSLNAGKQLTKGEYFLANAPDEEEEGDKEEDPNQPPTCVLCNTLFPSLPSSHTMTCPSCHTEQLAPGVVDEDDEEECLPSNCYRFCLVDVNMESKGNYSINDEENSSDLEELRLTAVILSPDNDYEDHDRCSMLPFLDTRLWTWATGLEGTFYEYFHIRRGKQHSDEWTLEDRHMSIEAARECLLAMGMKEERKIGEDNIISDFHILSLEKKEATNNNSVREESLETSLKNSTLRENTTTIVSNNNGKPLLGCVFVVSGSFSVSQKEMCSLIEAGGGTVASSFTKSVTHCIASEIGSSKTTKARDSGIPVCTEEWIRHCLLTGQMAVDDSENAHFFLANPPSS